MPERSASQKLNIKLTELVTKSTHGIQTSSVEDQSSVMCVR
jgi:hypothetical protein